jgi:FAD/FMN-containing dehydrogenase
VGSEGTLGFVAEATFRTVALKKFAATSLLIVPDLATANTQLSHLIESLPLPVSARLSTDANERAALWHVRKGLYATVAGAHPP